MDTLKQSFEKISLQAKQDEVRVELLISGGESLSIGYQKKKLDTFKSSQTQMAGFRVIHGPNQGYAYTENLSEESLLRTYREALNNSQTVQKAGDLDVPLVKPQSVSPMAEMFKDENIDMAEKLEVARRLEEETLSGDARVQSVPYSGFSESSMFKRILNTEGLDQEFKQSYYTGYAYALAKEGEKSKMDGEEFFTRSFKDIDVAKVARAGVQKSVSRLGAGKLTTGNYAVVIDREQFPTILHMIQNYFSAKYVDEGKSLFEGKVNQKIASEKLTLVDDPFNMAGTSIRPFDDEGAASRRTSLIEQGVLKNYLTNLEYATKLNIPHTANGRRSPASALAIASSNMVVAKGEKSLQDLLASHEKVVFMTNFEGGLHAGFKESTGDFSMPAEGFLYVNGKNTGAVDQFVMSGNVLTLLTEIEDLSNEYNKPGNSMICPDVLIKSLSFAGA